jgi:hypothetical protein
MSVLAWAFAVRENALSYKKVASTELGGFLSLGAEGETDRHLM